MFRLCLVIATLVSTSRSYEINEASEGLPLGYMADCPGIEKAQPLSSFQKLFLTITVYSHGKSFSRRTYNYHQISHLLIPPNTDFSKPTVVYVGGYLESSLLWPYARRVRKEYNKYGYNVIVVNTFMFFATFYPKAARNTRAVGESVAEMLVAFTKYGLNPKNLQLLGFSLGTHTSGFIAKHFRRLTGQTIARITALDPAGPCFRNLGPNDRLDKTDADFVDVVHTNMDGFGIAVPIGHVDFYVNGGAYLPGSISWIPCTVLCSHLKAFDVWEAALQYPDKFIATKCDSVNDVRNGQCYNRKYTGANVLGLNTDENTQGVFYLPISNKRPYFLGLSGLKY